MMLLEQLLDFAPAPLPRHLCNNVEHRGQFLKASALTLQVRVCNCGTTSASGRRQHM